jgi:diamine N-acetyltransferase
MVELKTATSEDWSIIRDIAYATWPRTFGELMSREQLEYMLSLIYSEESLKHQMDHLNHHFILSLHNNIPVGFASYEFNYKSEAQFMIHKVYLLPQSQGLGIGKKIFTYLTELAKSSNQKRLRLKLFYKNDKARTFYQHHGFTIAGTETTDIGNGYIILDDVMIKEIGR